MKVLRTVKAHCNKCKAKFLWMPAFINSIRSEDVYPRCPECGSYRETSSDGEGPTIDLIIEHGDH